MRVAVRFFASLTKYRPTGTPGENAVIDLPEGSTVRELAHQLGIPDQLPRLVIVNGHEASADHRLEAGDSVSMFPPLQGGSAALNAECRARRGEV